MFRIRRPVVRFNPPLFTIRGLRRICAESGQSSGGRKGNSQHVFSTDNPPWPSPRGAGVDFAIQKASCSHGAAPRLRRVWRGGRRNKRPRKKSGFRKFCKKRAKRLGTNARAGNPFEVGNRPTVCFRCDRGQRRKCARLPHCRAKFRSPPNVNRREQGAPACTLATLTCPRDYCPGLPRTSLLTRRVCALSQPGSPPARRRRRRGRRAG